MLLLGVPHWTSATSSAAETPIYIRYSSVARSVDKAIAGVDSETNALRVSA